ncbi:uncharacterized protein [Macrobrachium rosenbergii]|uniref:uncharacterized protein n=1 Tax=Macrobrachium rosenbergii TaxID=79674 RepID=UPI0034D78B6D
MEAVRDLGRGSGTVHQGLAPLLVGVAPEIRGLVGFGSSDSFGGGSSSGSGFDSGLGGGSSGFGGSGSEGSGFGGGFGSSSSGSSGFDGGFGSLGGGSSNTGVPLPGISAGFSSKDGLSANEAGSDLGASSPGSTIPEVPLQGPPFPSDTPTEAENTINGKSTGQPKNTSVFPFFEQGPPELVTEQAAGGHNLPLDPIVSESNSDTNTKVEIPLQDLEITNNEIHADTPTTTEAQDVVKVYFDIYGLKMLKDDAAFPGRRSPAPTNLELPKA